MLTQEYKAASRSAASSFTGRCSAGTACSRLLLRPPVSGDSSKSGCQFCAAAQPQLAFLDRYRVELPISMLLHKVAQISCSKQSAQDSRILACLQKG